MATIHSTTLEPGELELLAAWLPRQPCCRGETPDMTVLAKAGGFRLDAPDGEGDDAVGWIAVDAADGTLRGHRRVVVVRR